MEIILLYQAPRELLRAALSISVSWRAYTGRAELPKAMMHRGARKRYAPHVSEALRIPATYRVKLNSSLIDGYSVGDGCIIGGLHKGLKDLMALGWIDHMPKLMGVQAAGSNYLAEAWEKGEDVLTKPPIDAQTRADSISPSPRRGMKVSSDGSPCAAIASARRRSSRPMRPASRMTMLIPPVRI